MVTVTGAVAEIYTGRIYLSLAQVRPRAHRLALIGRVSRDGIGLYEVTRGPVEFKAGEQIGFEGDVPKGLERVVSDLAGIEAEKQRQAEAEAKRIDAEREREAALAADRAAAELAATQHAELVAAMVGINGGDQGTIDINELTKLLDGRVNFDPTLEQLDAAWAAHVEALAK